MSWVVEQGMAINLDTVELIRQVFAGDTFRLRIQYQSGRELDLEYGTPEERTAARDRILAIITPPA
jgi:hypothetical protein